MDEFGKRDLQGRMKVMYALQMEYPDLVVASTDLKCRWDLEVWAIDNPSHKVFLEVKDRDCTEDRYDSAFLNPEKFDSASALTTDWMFVNVYTDGKIDFWRPYAMPQSGITEEHHYIAKTTVNGGEKKKQRRLCLNFNDIYLRLHNNLKIEDNGRER